VEPSVFHVSLAYVSQGSRQILIKRLSVGEQVELRRIHGATAPSKADIGAYIPSTHQCLGLIPSLFAQQIEAFMCSGSIVTAKVHHVVGGGDLP